jgi:maltooligosyltrehalose trehalohydrolase
MLGERLTTLANFESLKLAAATVLLSPFLPLLFMGEEYGEDAPFLYFVDHSDPGLIEAVRSGRKEEFASFGWAEEPPDPQAFSTFERSRLAQDPGDERQSTLREFYRELIALRKNDPALALLSPDHLDAVAFEKQRVLLVRRWNGPASVSMAFHFGDEETTLALPVRSGSWTRLVHSGDRRWLGPRDLPDTIHSDGEILLTLAPRSFAAYSAVRERGR